MTYTAGITDDSSTEAFAAFSVYGGGRLLKRHRLGFGEHASRSVNVKGVLRLKLEAVGLEQVYIDSAKAGWGDPKVRCTRL